MTDANDNKGVPAGASPSGVPKGRKTYTEPGEIVLREDGEEACQAGYMTTDPGWVGRYAIQYGDINPDGTLN